MQLEDKLEEQEAIANVAYKLLKGNPRQIKRLLNTYRYVKVLGYRTEKPIDLPEWQESTVNWLALTMRWPIFMELFVKTENEKFSPSQSPFTKDHYNLIVKETKKVGSNEDVPSLETFLDFLPASNWFVDYLELVNNFIIEKPPRKRVSLALEKTENDSIN